MLVRKAYDEALAGEEITFDGSASSDADGEIAAQADTAELQARAAHLSVPHGDLSFLLTEERKAPQISTDSHR